MPVAVGSIAGCEGGAATGGRLLRSIPSSTFGLISSAEGAETVGGAAKFGVARDLEAGVLVGGGWETGGSAGPPRSRGVYSVVNDGPGGGAEQRRWICCQHLERGKNGGQTFLGCGSRIAYHGSIRPEERLRTRKKQRTRGLHTVSRGFDWRVPL